VRILTSAFSNSEMGSPHARQRGKKAKIERAIVSRMGSL